MNIFDLTNEVAVVLGAGGALGGAMAEGLAEAGASVAVLDFAVERGEARAQSIRSKGRKAIFVHANALDRHSLRIAHEAVVRELGAPTVLVNAVGGNDPAAQVTEEQPFENLSFEAWRANFDLNLCGGVLFPCQEFGAGMVQRRRGSIINIASVSAHVPLSRVVAYSAAKAAVLSLTKFLAREWATKGVRVNSITPGFFPAEQNKRLLFNPDGSPTPRAKAILDHTPMRRMGEPTELIGAVIFLASERASGFVTGADIRVDGGFLAQTI